MSKSAWGRIDVVAKQRRTRSAVTLVEIVVSTMIVGVLMVATLSALGGATKSSQSAGNRAVAIGLADDLMAEILKAKYVDPGTSPTFGPETGESGTTRAAFNDVDDYNGWSEQPPAAHDGTTMDGTAMTRSQRLEATRDGRTCEGERSDADVDDRNRHQTDSSRRRLQGNERRRANCLAHRHRSMTN